jgi:hypothetical protein
MAASLAGNGSRLIRHSSKKARPATAAQNGKSGTQSLCENSGFLLFFSGFLDFSHRLSGVLDRVGQEMDRTGRPNSLINTQTISLAARYVGDDPVAYERRVFNRRR